MLQVALTGGIGSGKSLVGELFAQLGASVIDFDQLARDVVDRGTEGFDEVLTRFGDEILSNGYLDRAKLAHVVFNDPQALSELEEIVHPRIYIAYTKFLKVQEEDAVVIAEIPLLTESQTNYHFDFVIAVEADERARRSRLRERGMTDFAIEQRLRAQLGDQERRAIADFVIHNHGSRDELLRQVENLYEVRLYPMRDFSSRNSGGEM